MGEPDVPEVAAVVIPINIVVNAKMRIKDLIFIEILLLSVFIKYALAGISCQRSKTNFESNFFQLQTIISMTGGC